MVRQIGILFGGLVVLMTLGCIVTPGGMTFASNTAPTDKALSSGYVTSKCKRNASVWEWKEVEHTGINHFNHVYILTDPDTGVEYIVIQNGEEVGITPRIKQ